MEKYQMTEEEIAQFKQKLLDLRKDLQVQEKMVKEEKSPVELDQSRVGRISRMDTMQAQQMALAGARRREHQLVKNKWCHASHRSRRIW